MLEEADITLRDVVPLGYQEIHSDGTAPFAQLRVRRHGEGVAAGDAGPRQRPGLPPRMGASWQGLRPARLGRAGPRPAAAAEVAGNVYGFATAAFVISGTTAHSAPVTQVV